MVNSSSESEMDDGESDSDSDDNGVTANAAKRTKTSTAGNNTSSNSRNDNDSSSNRRIRRSNVDGNVGNGNDNPAHNVNGNNNPAANNIVLEESDADKRITDIIAAAGTIIAAASATDAAAAIANTPVGVNNVPIGTIKKAPAHPVFFNELAYHSNPHTGKAVKPNTASKNKGRDADIIVEALDRCGTPERAALALCHVFTVKRKEFGELFKMLTVDSPLKKSRHVHAAIVDNVRSFFQKTGCLGSSTNDALSFQKTAFCMMVPEAPAEGAEKAEVRRHEIMMKQVADEIGLCSKTQKDRFRDAAVIRRNMMMAPARDKKTLLMQQHVRKSRIKHSNETKEGMIDWVYNKSPLVIDSPNKGDERMVKHLDGTKTMEQKKLCNGSMFDLCEGMIKKVGGFAGARDQNGEVIISLSFFVKNMPANLVRHTNSQKASCGCGSCLDAKGCLGSLNHFRTMLWKHLKCAF